MGQKKRTFVNFNSKKNTQLNFSPLRKNIQRNISFVNEQLTEPFMENINKNKKFINQQIIQIKKLFVNYEEPYSEISQNRTVFKINVKLPDVKKKDMVLKIISKKVQFSEYKFIKINKHKKVMRGFYRSISLPPNANVKKAQAIYFHGSLKVKIPLKKI